MKGQKNKKKICKDRTDLKFYTNCGVGDHSLEDFPIMLEKINKKKMLMSCCVCKNMIVSIQRIYIS